MDDTIEKIGSTFRNHFVSKLSKPRTIGREAEFPVVTHTGEAADVRKVLAKLDESGDLRLKQLGDHGLYGDDYEYRWEGGKARDERWLGARAGGGGGARGKSGGSFWEGDPPVLARAGPAPRARHARGGQGLPASELCAVCFLVRRCALCVTPRRSLEVGTGTVEV